MISPAYRSQVDLLIRILPHVANETMFALKGGTAINLFERGMPRFSIDIDLTYLPFKERAEALGEIADGLRRIKQSLAGAIPGIQINESSPRDAEETKLICLLQKAQVKIEVNTIMRGQLWPIRDMQLAQNAQEEFQKFAAINVVSHAELHGGKICAALDRQHPRDLFDVHQLLSSDGLIEEVRLGFIAALLSHPRPLHEVIRPNFQDQRNLFDAQFAGMTNQSFTYDEYESTRERLVREILENLTDEDRNLLLSFKRGEPTWSLFPVAALQQLPAVQWKLANIQRLKKNARKHAEQLQALEVALS